MGKSTNIMLLSSKTSLKELGDNGEIGSNDITLLAKKVNRKCPINLMAMPGIK